MSSGAWRERYVDIDGVRTHYLEAGEGETILLIHGGGVWSCAELNYGPVFPCLSDHFRVVAVDVPGFGLTDGRAPQHFSETARGDFLVRFLRSLGTKVHLGGNSVGGWLALYLALEVPELVQSLHLINSGSVVVSDRRDDDETRYDPRWAVPATRPTAAWVRRELREFYLNSAVITDERVELTLAMASRNYDFAVARQLATGTTSEERNRYLWYRGRPISEHVGTLAMPVLVSWSRENRGASVAQALPTFDRLAAAEMHVWVGAGHHVQVEYPESWSAVVRTFIETRAGPGGRR
ncbi:MAG: alpha/beta hydrolase [Truepera sp.]|nr:alpha/beta hydrolase [Truepera sp.]